MRSADEKTTDLLLGVQLPGGPRSVTGRINQTPGVRPSAEPTSEKS